ncbi:choloylglycine hydrolase family protein [Enterococcus sp. LJL99]
MCTGIFTKTKDNKHLLARTMDFSFPLNPDVVYLPRDYTWVSDADKTEHQSKYGFLGAGRMLESTYSVADGVNEHGLAIAELYLPQKAVYQKEVNEEKINIAPHEFIIWALGNFKSISDLKQTLSKVNLLEVPAPLVNTITPLHWILTDTTGNCMVIEPTGKMLHLKDNPVGVMTNTPLLEWHIENLSNYLNVRPEQYEPNVYGNYTAKAFSQGTGTLGLPGGYTPPERFVRAAFFKENIDEAATEIEAVTNAIRVLATVQIPKGIVVTTEGKEDYSQYIGMMCNESKSYYFTDYNNTRISKIELTQELLDRKKPKVFVTKKTEDIKNLNEKIVPKELKQNNEKKKVTQVENLLDMLGQELVMGVEASKSGNLDSDTHELISQTIDQLKKLRSN